MLESGLFFDETARVTRLYVEAERLIDRLLVTPHPTPVAVVVQSLRFPVTVISRDDEGFEAIFNIADWAPGELSESWGK
jgi:hypothetical protein